MLYAHDATTLSYRDDQLDDTRVSNIINHRLDASNNYLHKLSNRLTAENYMEVSEMIKVLVTFKCNPNLQNNEMKTPFYILLKNLEGIKDANDLVNFLIKNTDINFNENVIKLIQARGIPTENILREKPVCDFAKIMRLIAQYDEAEVINCFGNFQQTSQSEIAKLLQESIVRNLFEVVNYFLMNGVDVNYASNANQMTPANLACSLGHHEVLKVLLTEKSLIFRNDVTQWSLLHQICSSVKVHAIDRQKCFNLIVTDRRCTKEIINGLDEKGFSPLCYASEHGFSEIVMNLLRRGAFIGYEPVISSLKNDVLKAFLDESVKLSGDLNDKSCEIHIDYRFLMPPQDSDQHLEVQAAQWIAKSGNLKEQTLHPVIRSFWEIKWKKIEFLVYFNTLVYFMFMLFLGYFIINFFSDSVYDGFGPTSIDNRFDAENNNTTEIQTSFPDNVNFFAMLFGIRSKDDERFKRQTNNDELKAIRAWNKRNEEHFQENAWSYRFCLFGVVLLTFYEIAQCITTFKRYFLDLSNWVDIAMLTLSYIVLVGWFRVHPQNFKKVRASTILIMAAQTIQLISKIPFLSMSLHMAMFKRFDRKSNQ